jgi:CheY-like chemotaxis protein
MITTTSSGNLNLAEILTAEIDKFRQFSPGQPPYLVVNLAEHAECPILSESIVLRRLIQLALSCCYLSGRYDYPVLINTATGSDHLQISFQIPWDGSGQGAQADSLGSLELHRVFLQPKRDVQRELSIMMLRRFAGARGIKIEIRHSAETGMTIICSMPWESPHMRKERAKPLVLIVEDIVPIYRLMHMYLQVSGCETAWAPRGDLGYEMAVELNPDLIVLNVCMPVMDGYQCLMELKGNEATRAIPVVMCSVLHDEERSMELGAADHIIKPIYREDFLARVRRALEPRRGRAPQATPLPDSVCLLSASDAWNAMMKDALDADRKVTINTAGDFALDQVLHLQLMVDVFVMDMTRECDHLYSMILMIRLSPGFENVPIIAVTSKKTDAAARYWYEGLVDDFVSEAALLRRQIDKMRLESECVG